MTLRSVRIHDVLYSERLRGHSTSIKGRPIAPWEPVAYPGMAFGDPSNREFVQKNVPAVDNPADMYEASSDMEELVTAGPSRNTRAEDLTGVGDEPVSESDESDESEGSNEGDESDESKESDESEDEENSDNHGHIHGGGGGNHGHVYGGGDKRKGKDSKTSCFC